ncbi:MAG: hypothetical protein J0L86_04990 [Flavobacteriales bacterium]|nr:hypothetical protein [Flavobacteriales bacterium]
MKKLLFLLSLIVLTSCFNDKYVFLGEKKIYEMGILKVRFYQKNEFEMTNPLFYELLNKNDSTIIGMRFLTGTHDIHGDAEDFYPSIHDSILYICYPNHHNVCIIEDLKKNRLISEDSLFAILKENNKTLILE